MEKENQNIEFKLNWKDEYLNWICSFANATGGKLYIGIDNGGNIIGIDDAHVLMESLPNKIRDAMGIVADINLLVEDNKEYLEIVIEPYPVAISCKGNYYYRSGTTTHKLTGIELESFILRKRGVTWDNLPQTHLTINDLDMSNIRKFKSLAISKKRIDDVILEEDTMLLLDKLHLLKKGYLTNAALLLFAKDPERYFLGAYIKVGYFINNADLLYQDEVHGSLFEQVDKTIELIYFKYMKAIISYSGLQRVERYFVTRESLREAILNAVVHKRYESGIPIQISIYKDKLYISNDGQLPDDWTADNLYDKHRSRPYNPNIAHAFYLAGQIESWGRGVEKICESCKKNNLPLPLYHIVTGEVMIEFNAPKELVIDDFVYVADQTIISKNDTVTDNELKVLELLYEDPGYTTTKIAEILNLNRKTVSLRIKALKEKGVIERIGSDRKGYWRINK